MVECVKECRVLDEDYNAVLGGLNVLDENPLLKQLLAERDAVKNDHDSIEKELEAANEAYQRAFDKMNQVEGRLETLAVRMEEASMREAEAIRISNAKDPRVEELGAW